MLEFSFALDRASARTIDQDGHLHIAKSLLTRAEVSQYLGSEIPDAEKLGLEPSKLYSLYRDPEELKKGMPTLNGKPLLIRHKPITAEDHPSNIVVGSVSNPEFKDGDVTAELVVWDQDAIDRIEEGSKRHLSCGYRYIPDMKGGTAPDGQSYDGVMRGIQFNHCALVEEPRIKDAMVADTAEDLQWHRIASALVAFDAEGDWEESKHPRSPDGKFGKGSGGGNPAKAGTPNNPYNATYRDYLDKARQAQAAGKKPASPSASKPEPKKTTAKPKVAPAKEKFAAHHATEKSREFATKEERDRFIRREGDRSRLWATGESDAGKELASQKPAAPLKARELKAFAKAVNEMAGKVSGERVPISQLHSQGAAPGSLEQFKEHLAAAAKKGLVELERHDTAGGKPEGSEMMLGREPKHYVVKPAPKPAKPKKPTNAERKRIEEDMIDAGRSLAVSRSQRAGPEEIAAQEARHREAKAKYDALPSKSAAPKKPKAEKAPVNVGAHAEALLGANVDVEAFQKALTALQAAKPSKAILSEIANRFANAPTGATHQRKFKSKADALFRLNDVFRERAEAQQKDAIIKRMHQFPKA